MVLYTHRGQTPDIDFGGNRNEKGNRGRGRKKRKGYRCCDLLWSDKGVIWNVQCCVDGGIDMWDSLSRVRKRLDCDIDIYAIKRRFFCFCFVFFGVWQRCEFGG